MVIYDDSVEDMLIKAAGGVVENGRVASTTLSEYATLRCGNRVVQLRASDHGNFPNPRCAHTARKATLLRTTAPGFLRALALWLGWEEHQLTGLNLKTKRDVRKLISMTKGATDVGQNNA